MRTRLALILASPLLMAEQCMPVPPEQDPVVASDPEAVARLEAEHGEVLTLLRDYLDHRDPDDDRVRYRVRPGTIAWDDLQALSGAIPRLERIVAVEYAGPLDEETEPFCGEGGEVTTFTLDLLVRDFPRAEGETVVVQLCRVEDEGPDVVGLTGEAELIRDQEWAARVLRRSEAEVMRLLENYEDDRGLERQRILSRWLGCPDGTAYRNDGEAHFCASGDVRHGPYVEGGLTEALVGPRRVVGQYRDGCPAGTWRQYDELGALVATTERRCEPPAPEATPQP